MIGAGVENVSADVSSFDDTVDVIRPDIIYDRLSSRPIRVISNASFLGRANTAIVSGGGPGSWLVSSIVRRRRPRQRDDVEFRGSEVLQLRRRERRARKGATPPLRVEEWRCGRAPQHGGAEALEETGVVVQSDCEIFVLAQSVDRSLAEPRCDQRRRGAAALHALADQRDERQARPQRVERRGVLRLDDRVEADVGGAFGPFVVDPRHERREHEPRRKHAARRELGCEARQHGLVERVLHQDERRRGAAAEDVGPYVDDHGIDLAELRK
mmetsp:Transcript_20294/g.69680  ORF Transcript_20294/g.69680 Transcript_20294/m.69680 type:complete len:270 (-) Transcript_20294:617-1426(-)